MKRIIIIISAVLLMQTIAVAQSYTQQNGSPANNTYARSRASAKAQKKAARKERNTSHAMPASVTNHLNNINDKAGNGNMDNNVNSSMNVNTVGDGQKNSK